MNELERDKLKVLLSDTVLLGALYKVFMEAADEAIPVIQGYENDAVVGQKYRAYDSAKKLIMGVFRKLEELRPPELSTDDLPSPE